MKPNKFRVYYEYEIDGEIHRGIESEASWFLLTQSGELLQHGPLEPLRDCKEYKKLIPLFYTGRKDKNGTEMYDGDIIKEGGRISKVRFSKSYARFELETPTGRAGLYGFYGEIIGNVYENPELLIQRGIG